MKLAKEKYFDDVGWGGVGTRSWGVWCAPPYPHVTPLRIDRATLNHLHFCRLSAILSFLPGVGRRGDKLDISYLLYWYQHTHTLTHTRPQSEAIQTRGRLQISKCSQKTDVENDQEAINFISHPPENGDIDTHKVLHRGGSSDYTSVDMDWDVLGCSQWTTYCWWWWGDVGTVGTILTMPVITMCQQVNVPAPRSRTAMLCPSIGLAIVFIRN